MTPREDSLTTPELVRALDVVEAHLRDGRSAAELARALGLENGVSGFILHTVPVSLFCAWRYGGDFRAAIEATVRLGGDTDSTAAIVGGLVGAARGTSALPDAWVSQLADWPRSAAWMRALAQRLARQLPASGDPVLPQGALPLFWPGLLVRNAAFLAGVLTLGLRRLLPPY